MRSDVEPTKPSSPHNDGAAPLNLGGLNTADYLKAEAKLTIEEKSAFATGLARALNVQSGDTAHFTEAEAILRLLIWNAEPRVVEAIGNAVAGNPHAPKSLAWALANDDEAAALPVLQSFAGLSDDDLVAIVENSGNFSKMGAIAARSTVSEQISRSLVKHGDESTMQSLLANVKAVIPEEAFGHMLDRFGEHARVQEGVADREGLSASIAQRLAESGNASVTAKLELRRQTPKFARVPGYLDETTSEEELERQVSKSVADKSINELGLVHHLCLGEFDFFCRALSAMTGSTKNEVCARILESPSDHLAQYWDQAALPLTWLPIACAAASALIQIDENYSKNDRQLFSKNIIDRTVAILKADKFTMNDAQRRFFMRHGVRLGGS